MAVVPMKKPDPAELAREQIEAVAKTASLDDRKRVEEIVRTAKMGKKENSKVMIITPAMAAIIFLEHNAHNRDWRAEGGNKSAREYERRMRGGHWRYNNQGIGFYVDGQLEDGQHRLSASAHPLHEWST
jgi:hypothetical protein